MPPCTGFSGFEDEIGSDGHVMHRTKLITLNSAGSWISNGTYTNTARFDLSTALTGGRAISQNKLMCSHFTPLYGDTSDTEQLPKLGRGKPSIPNCVHQQVKADRLVGRVDRSAEGRLV